MSFLSLIFHDVWVKKVRSGLTAFAIGIGVMTVVALGLVTTSIRTTAAGVLEVGAADLTIAQGGVTDILQSSISEAQLDRLRQEPGVASAVGVMLDTESLNADNPLLVEIGIDPADLGPFGVTVASGRPFGAQADGEIMVGSRLAQNEGIALGDTLELAGGPKTVVGIYTTGNVFGDSAVMFPLIPLQGYENQPGGLSLLFVKVTPDTDVATLRQQIERDNPALVGISNLTEFGRADRGYQLITAADRGATIVAVVIGAIIVMNTMLLSLVERYREFGILRAVGWSRRRIVVLVLGEALTIGFAGAAVGVFLAWILTSILARLPELEGILHPDYTAGVFARALFTAAAVAFLGALYPAIRAARLTPLEALRRE